MINITRRAVLPDVALWIWRVEPRRFAKELMTAGLAVIKIQRTQRKMVLFSVLRVFLFAISAVKGT